MNQLRYEYDVEYKEKDDEDWIFWDSFYTLKKAKKEIECQKENDKECDINFDYRIIGKKTITIEWEVIE